MFLTVSLQCGSMRECSVTLGSASDKRERDAETTRKRRRDRGNYNIQKEQKRKRERDREKERERERKRGREIYRERERESQIQRDPWNVASVFKCIPGYPSRYTKLQCSLYSNGSNLDRTNYRSKKNSMHPHPQYE